MAKEKHKESANGMSALLVHQPGGDVQEAFAVKSAGMKNTGYVEGYLVSWGNESDTDLQGEHFTPRTEFCLDWFTERPVLYHHGLDGEAGLRKIGSIKALEHDELGLWVQAQIDLRDRYANAVYDMVKSKEFGWSSGSVDHLVKIAPNGEIVVWPLIEGSITPTPAQPSKTNVRAYRSGDDMEAAYKSLSIPPSITMQAFKALLGKGSEDAEYLRGLSARVDSSAISTTKSFYMDLKGVEPMASKNTSRRLARAYASAFGIRASEDEIDAVASELEPEVQDEVASAAEEELEMEAALASLEEEMVEEPTTMSYTRSHKRRSRRGWRSQDEAAAMAEDIAADVEDELAAQMEDIASTMADDMAANLEDELAAQMDEEAMEKSAARAIRRRIMRRALRQLDATDDTGAVVANDVDIEAGGNGELDMLGDQSFDNPPIENFKRYRRSRRARRGYAYREGDEALLSDDAILEDEALLSDDAELVEQVAAAAYRNGMRKGKRIGLGIGLRTTDEIGADVPVIVENNDEPGNYSRVEDGGEITTPKRYSRSRRARRGYAYREGDEALLADEAMLEDEAFLTDEALLADEAMLEDEALLTDEEPTIASRRYRRRLAARRAARRAAARRAMRRARRGYAYREGDEALLADEAMLEDEALLADEAMLEDEAFLTDEALLADEAILEDEAFLADEELAAMSEEPTIASRRYRRRRAKSMDYSDQVNYWKSRAMKAELTEAPSQRSFGRVKSVVDVADQPGGYSHAFKSYLRFGTDKMSTTQKNVLNRKGQTNWGAVKGVYESPLGVDPRIKTYMGGVDASGGFAVPPDWVAELNKNIQSQTVMAPECRTRVTTSDTIVQPNVVTTDARRASSAVVHWPGENPAAGDHLTTQDTFSQINVPINVMLLSQYATNSMLEDSTFNLESHINDAFSEAVAISYDQDIWGGHGQGKMEGIVVSSLVTTNRSTGMATPSGYVPTGSPDGIVTADSLKEMLFHLPPGFRAKSKWYMNENTGLQVATLKDGEGRYLMDNGNNNDLQSSGVPERLLGRPIVYNHWADDIGSGAFPIILADLSRGYLIGKRVDFSIKRFDDSTQALQDQVLFLGRARVGGQVATHTAIKVLKVAAS